MAQIIQFQCGPKKQDEQHTGSLSDDQIAALGLTTTLEKYYKTIGRPIVDILNANGLFAGLLIRVGSSTNGVRETYYIPKEGEDRNLPVDPSQICLQIYHSLAGTKFQGNWPASYTDTQIERWEKLVAYSEENGTAQHTCSLVGHAIGSITTGVGCLSGVVNPATLPDAPLIAPTGYDFSIYDPNMFTDFYYFGEYLITVNTHMKNVNREHIERLNPDNTDRVGFFEPLES